MLMDLGPVVYVEDFEKHFLAKAAEFYQVRNHQHHDPVVDIQLCSSQKHHALSSCEFVQALPSCI